MPKNAIPVGQCKMIKNRSCCKNVDFHSTFAAPYLWIQANYGQLNGILCSHGPSGSTKIAVLAMIKNSLFLLIKSCPFVELEIAIWSYAHRQIVNLHRHYVDFSWIIAVFLCIAAIAKIAWSYSQR